MERIPMESRTGMCGIGYDPETQTLEIEFKSRKEGESNALYHYHNVAQEDFDAFVAAESQGSRFMKNIKPKFKCTKLPPPEQAEGASA